MPVRMRMDVLAVSSYRATTHQGTRVLYPTAFDVRDRQVLVIDDILDSGGTLRTVTECCASRAPWASRRACS